MLCDLECNSFSVQLLNCNHGGHMWSQERKMLARQELSMFMMIKEVQLLGKHKKLCLLQRNLIFVFHA